MDRVCSLSVSERPLPGRKVVLRPERLSADFELVNGTLLMTLRWRLSQHARDPAAVEGFQFTWTLLSKVKSDKEGLEDTVISQTLTVAPVRVTNRELFHFLVLLMQHYCNDWSVSAAVYLKFYSLQKILLTAVYDCYRPIYSGSHLSTAVTFKCFVVLFAPAY